MAPTEMTTDIPEHADLTPRAYWIAARAGSARPPAPRHLVRRREPALVPIDFNGELTHYLTLPPGASMRQQTYVGHRWVIRTEQGVLGQFVAAPGDHELSIDPP